MCGVRDLGEEEVKSEAFMPQSGGEEVVLRGMRGFREVTSPASFFR